MRRSRMPLEQMTRYLNLSQPKRMRSKFEKNAAPPRKPPPTESTISDRLLEISKPRITFNLHFVPYSHYLHIIDRI